MPTVIIGADLCPIEGNLPHFEQGDARSLFHELLLEFEAADLVVANLEGPFIESPSPICKTGPTFGFPVTSLSAIKAAGIDVLGLANNHILDHGEAGLRHTLAACAEVGIATVGAGENLESAGRLLIRDLNGLRVALMAVAEHEFSIAGRDQWGANPIDLIEYVRTVRRQRSEFDHLIVLYHGADEFFAPTPQTQKTCRFMVEEGASAVIVQHPHIVGGVEAWQDGHIVYGQGALVMDEAIYRNQASFHDGFLVRLTLDHQPGSNLDLIPFRQSAPVPGARRLADTEKEEFLKVLHRRSAAISDPRFVAQEWEVACARETSVALGSLLGHGGLLRRSGLSQLWSRLLLRSRHGFGIRNMVRCETHREKLVTVLQAMDAQQP